MFLIGRKKYLIITGLCCLIGNLINAQDTDELLRSSIQYSDKGAYQQALNLIDRAISVDSTKPDLLMQRANVYYHLGKYDNTIRDCYATLRFKPDIPEVYLLRGKVCMVTESYGGAILFFGKALKYANDTKLQFEIFLNRGKAYFALNRYLDAYNDYQAAYAIDQNSIDVLMALAETNLKLSKTNEAMATINKIIAANPDRAEAYDLLGQIAIKTNNMPEAIKAFEKYTVLKPDESSAFNALANAYLIDEQYDKAMNCLNKSITLDPNDPGTYKIKGEIYIIVGDTEKGCNAFFRSMQLGYFERYGYDLLDLYINNCEK